MSDFWNSSGNIVRMYILFLIIFLLLFAGIGFLLFKVIADSVKGKGNLGINLSLPNCPNCGTGVPAIRKPTSARQALWGGWTCSNCGCEVDKWGKEINTARVKTAQKQFGEAKANFVQPFDEKGKTPVEKVFEEKNK